MNCTFVISFDLETEEAMVELSTDHGRSATPVEYLTVEQVLRLIEERSNIRNREIVSEMLAARPSKRRIDTVRSFQSLKWKLEAIIKLLAEIKAAITLKDYREIYSEYYELYNTTMLFYKQRYENG